MVIIGLLAATVVPKFFGQVDKAMQQDAQAQIELLGQALDLYRLETHKYPASDVGLNAIKPYLKSSKLKKININEKWAERSIKIAIKNDDSIGKAGALLLNHLIS